jgi:hypothetical protein
MQVRDEQRINRPVARPCLESGHSVLALLPPTCSTRFQANKVPSPDKSYRNVAAQRYLTDSRFPLIPFLGTWATLPLGMEKCV